MLALLLDEGQAARIVGIFVPVERISNPGRVASRWLAVIHDVMFLHTPHVASIAERIGACNIHKEMPVQFPDEFSIRRKLAQHRAHLAHGDVQVAVLVHAEAANAPELIGLDFARNARRDAAGLAERLRQFGMLNVADVEEQNLLF